MASNLPSRPKGVKNGPRTFDRTSAADSGTLLNSQAMENDSGMEESDDEPTINDKGIEELMAKLHRLINNLVGIISKEVILDQFSWPQLADMHIWYSECYHLFRLALGFQDKTLDSAFRQLRVNLNDITVYLRTLVAADVYHRVLATEYPDLPFFSQQWIDATFDPVIKKLDAPSRSEVKKIATRALSKQKNVDEKLTKLPAELATEFFEALYPLLLCYKSPAVDREARRARQQKLVEQYGKRLAEVYKQAIGLRKALSLKSFSYSFFWIDAGEEFDEATMDAEIHLRRDESYEAANKGKPKVIATTLPGICRNDGQDERPIFSAEPAKEENIVLRALVYLREPERGQ